MKVTLASSALAALASAYLCDAAAGQPGQEGRTEPVQDHAGHTIDAQAGSVAGLTVGMSEAELQEAGWPYETYTEFLEGEEYKIYDAILPDGVRLKCTLYDNMVWRIDSFTPGVHDEYGLGVGSRLGELRASYPAGWFVARREEGWYAAFLTGTRIVFRFDTDDLDEACFEVGRECEVDDNVMVRSVSVY